MNELHIAFVVVGGLVMPLMGGTSLLVYLIGAILIPTDLIVASRL